jgi:hypothetical protein
MTWEEIKSEISIGTILDLRTKYKDLKSKNIGLDFYDFDAILPFKEIANEYELRFALFNSIKKDETISLVLIEINEEKKQLIFSTKIFRNALDDILSFTKCKLIVENNRNTHLKIDSKFLKQNRNILDRLRGDLSSNELTFLYELIQNAVDHANRNFNNNVSITFEVFNNYLLVKHNGALFTENNFESITGILYGEQTQEGEKSRIGYKGIGFKSVFRFTDNAYIRSGNFSFRFSKEESGSDKPWEVLPLFQIEKDMVEKIPQFDFFNSPVAFAFEFNNEKNKLDVIKYLNQLSENPYLLIFLENLNQLKIKAPGIDYIDKGVKYTIRPLNLNFRKELISESNFDSIKLFLNNTSHSQWLIYTKNDIIITNQEVITELLDESVTAVPAKMRNFRSPRITIALPNHSLDMNIINLFTYLPLSNAKFKLPFLVNADFIPDLDRTDIIHNLKYNEEVLRWVAVALKELSQVLVNKNGLSDLNSLIPDLSLSYPIAAEYIVNKFLDFIPEITLTIQGQDITLSKIIIDKTGFLLNFGKSVFSEVIDNNIVPLNNLTACEKIEKLLEKTNPNAVFNFSKLKKKVSTGDLNFWLKEVSNNYKFIKYLNSNSYLDVLKDESIFLAEDGNLYQGHELYINLDIDSDSLRWLNYNKVLHHSITSELNDISLPLNKYDPILFINEVICKEQKQNIIDGLKTTKISFNEFYTYLSKYINSHLFPITEIKEFPLNTNQGILPNWKSPLYFITNSLNILLLNNSLPPNTIYTIDDSSNCAFEKGFKDLAIMLGVISFTELEPYNFIQSNIVANKESISKFYFSEPNINIESNASLWSFISTSFENLSPVQITSLKPILRSLPILSKNNEFREVNSLYLSSEYTDNDSLEKLTEKFPSADIEFISSNYLQFSYIDKTKVKKLFKQLDAKDETIEFLQHTLLPNLNKMADELFIPLTRLIYENRESEHIVSAVINNVNFKLKTKEGNFKTIKECFIGEPYIDDTKISESLNFVPLINQISKDYSENQLDAWRRFFIEKLNITPLQSETEILNLKLKFLSENSHLLKNKEKSIELYNELYFLFKSEKLSLTVSNLNFIKNIPLLCKSDEISFMMPNMLHFSSIYKPVFDLESIFGIACGVSFLSDLYKFEDNNQIIIFFEQLGVTQLFEQSRHNAILQKVPTSDGLMKPANQLFKYEFKKVVGSANVSFKDLSIFVHNGKTLEDYFNFIPRLTVSSILVYILKNTPDKREFKELMVEFLKIYNTTNLNDRNLLNAFILKGKLLSTAKTYTPISSLYSIDESIRSGIKENEYLIDHLFNKIEYENRKRYLKLFNIKILGIDDFNPHFESELIEYEFTNRVKERLVFLAFDSDSEKYLEIENEFKEKFNEWKIKKCSKISLKFPELNSKIIKEDNRNFILSNSKTIYYIGNWTEQRNYLLVQWLMDNILNIQKQLQFIQDILLNNTTDIIVDFESKGRFIPDELKRRFNFIQTPITTVKSQNLIDEISINNNTKKDDRKAEISNKEEVSKDDIEKLDSNSNFLEDVKDFIAELEDSEWSDFIPELKSLLELSITQPREKQKLFNLIAKLKLAKEKNILLEIADKDYNHLENGDEKYFVHSARGAFAYIHPNEILKMRNDGYKMALDFSTKSRIKIYSTAEEILSLNTNHLLAYQKEKTIDELFSFCEANRDANKHLLIIDKDNSGEKSKALLKLLNNEDDYR